MRVDGPYRVKLTTGVPPFALAKGSADGIDRVSVEVEGRTLIVRQNRDSWGGYPGRAPGPVEIEVGTHELSQAPRLTAIVRGTSNLDAAGLAVKDAQIGAEGPSQVRLAATATAKIDARGTTSVAVSGNPSCTVKAEGSAVVTGCE